MRADRLYEAKRYREARVVQRQAARSNARDHRIGVRIDRAAFLSPNVELGLSPRKNPFEIQAGLKDGGY